jgi:lipid-A-disaccharide synthase
MFKNANVKTTRNPLEKSPFVKPFETIFEKKSLRANGVFTFIVAGELSGDKLGAWYVKKFCDSKTVHAIGGNSLIQTGAKIYENIDKLNFTGIVEIIKHIPFILTFIKKLSNHIIANNFEEVVLVDFPGFNLRLAKILKKKKPNIKITYLSPPQLWAWGARRIKKLKKFCDDVIVLYPFEVEWYKKRGLNVRWLGYPFYEKLESFFKKENEKIDQIAILAGSRNHEIKSLLPTFAKTIKQFLIKHPQVKIIMPMASTINKTIVTDILKTNNIEKDVTLIENENEKYNELSKCCLALTKPGTVTLELALLGIPAIVAFKTSWLSYFIGKAVVSIEYMSLPNLFANKEIYKEHIQTTFTEKILSEELNSNYLNFIKKNKQYLRMQDDLQKIRGLLKF